MWQQNNDINRRKEEIKNRLVIIMNINEIKMFTVNLTFWVVLLLLRMTNNIIPFNLQLNRIKQYT